MHHIHQCRGYVHVLIDLTKWLLFPTRATKKLASMDRDKAAIVPCTHRAILMHAFAIVLMCDQLHKCLSAVRLCLLCYYLLVPAVCRKTLGKYVFCVSTTIVIKYSNPRCLQPQNFTYVGG